ncbi:hypothetical protein B0H14DRAFT_3146032 [Mycena olivaceomarginata]|nr:hypothetical protein B0H14DRAFT_3146032 [Mycena olivaceomarginata]
MILLPSNCHHNVELFVRLCERSFLTQIKHSHATVVAASNSLDLMHLTEALEGNDPPLDSEIPLIRQIISEEVAQVAASDAQMRGLEDAPTELVAKRAEAVERIRQYRGLVSPVRRVPPELVCEIFALLLEDDEEIPPKPLWWLGHICRSWRLFVLGDTQFWTSIIIPTSPLRSDDCSMIEAQLLRSANALLKVYWVLSKRARTTPTMDPRMADLIVAECGRWASFHIDAPRLKSVEALDWLRPVKGRLSTLKKLEVLNEEDIVPDVFGIAPSLREVYLTEWDASLHSPSISIPWEQITRYRGAYGPKAQLAILQAASNVVHCVVGCEGTFEPDDLPSVALPRLRSLLIEHPDWLDRLKAPLLEDLACPIGEESRLIALLSFVRNSSCSLKRLVLVECAISPQLITALRGLPTLTHLVISPYLDSEGGNQTAFFDAMTVSGTSNEVVCPSLISFVYRAGEGLFPLDVFLTMIKSRLWPNHPLNARLTRLRVFDTDDNIEPGSFDAPFQLLCNDGVDAAFLVGDIEDLMKAEALF